MFSGFSDETVEFFLDLKFHNTTEFFRSNHDRYVSSVQKPFYEMISDLSKDMLSIDPRMEIRPYKALSHIHRDTRFSRDKSPYRDHLWFLFRKEAEPREKSLMYYFEFGPGRLGWGMGFWGENRNALDLFRKKMTADPQRILDIIRKTETAGNAFEIGGTTHKRIDIPAEIPDSLKRWYCAKEFYISRKSPDFRLAFSDQLIQEVRKDFIALSSLYMLFRGFADEAEDNASDDTRGHMP